MRQSGTASARTGRKLPLLLAAAGLAFGIPSTGLAVVAFSDPQATPMQGDFGIFTPATVDPQLARRVQQQIGAEGIRFTPAGNKAAGKRTVTVAVRMDGQTARAITLRNAIENVPSARETITASTSIAPTRYDLGIARGYQSFARPTSLPDSVRKIDMPDLSRFEPAGPTAPDKPSRFQPRIALQDRENVGRSQGTLEGQLSPSVDVGGAYRVTRNLDVTAGVRLSQDRDRIDPLTDSAQDSQAVYVGTQFRF